MRLRESASRLGISIAKSPEESTHIIHHPPENWSADGHDDFICQRFRLVFKEGRGILLHWMYSPGSFDSWHTSKYAIVIFLVSNINHTFNINSIRYYILFFTDLSFEWPFEIEPEPRVPGGTPWNVDARWLLYSEENREWMLEEDFLHASGSVRPRKSYSCMLSY